MRTESAPVSIRVPQADGSKKTTKVADAVFPVYDSVEEACDKHPGGEAAVLALINAMVETNEKNRVRGLKRDELTGSVSKKGLRDDATLRIFARPQSEWAHLLGDPAAYSAAIDAEVEVLKAEREAEAQQRLQEIAAAGGEEDEDENGD